MGLCEAPRLPGQKQLSTVVKDCMRKDESTGNLPCASKHVHRFDILLTVYHYVSQLRNQLTGFLGLGVWAGPTSTPPSPIHQADPQLTTSQQLQVHATHTKNC
jgi:hypothetical protein